jgi:hypothetical protein
LGVGASDVIGNEQYHCAKDGDEVGTHVEMGTVHIEFDFVAIPVDRRKDGCGEAQGQGDDDEDEIRDVGEGAAVGGVFFVCAKRRIAETNGHKDAYAVIGTHCTSGGVVDLAHSEEYFGGWVCVCVCVKDGGEGDD